MSIPQLRVRTGYSTRDIYGRPAQVAERLKEIECPFAACVDTHGTWAHVPFMKSVNAVGITAGFGMEIPLCREEDEKFRPRGWALASDTRKFYNFTSEVVQNDKRMTVSRLRECDSVLRFSGGAIELAEEMPDAFDYIDVNPASLILAKRAALLAKATGKPLVVTSFNDFPAEAHKAHAYAWEVRDSVGLRTIATIDEIWDAGLCHIMSRELFNKAIENTFLVAERLKDVHLQKAPLIHLDGSLLNECRAGQISRLERKHIAEWTQDYEDRLQRELTQIGIKEFDAYFLVVSDMIQFAKKHMLVGPARGSASGSLVCYLLGITEVDPLVHHLMFERFVDVSRGGFEYENFKGFGEAPYVKP